MRRIRQKGHPVTIIQTSRNGQVRKNIANNALVRRIKRKLGNARHLAKHDLGAESEQTHEQIVTSAMGHANDDMCLFDFSQHLIKPEHNRLGSLEPVALDRGILGLEKLVELFGDLKTLARLNLINRLGFDSSQFGADPLSLV